MPDRELIERLRRIVSGDFADAQEGVRFQDVITGAADRIEELERDTDFMAQQLLNCVSRTEANKLAGDWQELYLKAEAERKRDAAVLEGLTSEGAIEAADTTISMAHPVMHPRKQRIKIGIEAALQHAQSSVEGGDDG